MDLSTMGAKLEAGAYPDRFAFEKDLRLMINNAQLYNVVGTYAYNESKALEDFFSKRKLGACLIPYRDAHAPRRMGQGDKGS